MTSESLEDYLAGDYHQDMDDIRELEETLEAAGHVFLFTSNGGKWPYERRSHPDPKDVGGAISHGTQAMIAAALAKMCGLSTLPSGDPARLNVKSAEGLKRVHANGLDCLANSLATGPLRSGTFGLNDPVTLSHVTEVVRGSRRRGSPAIQKLLDGTEEATAELKAICKRNPASERLLEHLPSFFSTVADKAKQPLGREPDYVINAFVPLRVVRAVKNLSADKEDEWDCLLKSSSFNNFSSYFESTLYDQLSFSAIPDSRFDPAELIFCLEGLMLCAPHLVDERLFDHILEILRAKQEGNAQWCPNRPVFATPQGMTMLPVSVEGAVSLVRSIELFDRWRNFHEVSTRGVPLARRFWQWLRARKVQFAAAEPSSPENEPYRTFTGWHSEHVNDPDLIHLWDTSQVIEFMLLYREMLQRSIAGRTLKLSRLKIDRRATGLPVDWREKWKGVVHAFEPNPGMLSSNKIYEDLTEDFVEGWASGEPRNYSMLLYGPPGTGKSTLADNMAKALGIRMVTVTVSDFLGRGGEHIEARAKAIFQTLEAQFNTVILFDEIDSFLLDRDSKRYGKQETVFQFLTPGMLTKINDLRKLTRSLFIIATNYENRIDPAIKRKGRIDKHYLLGLPNALRRKMIIADLLNSTATLDEFSPHIGPAMLFFGYSDIKSAVEDAGGRAATLGMIAVTASEASRRPSTMETYLKRLGERDFPVQEFRGLFALWREVAKVDSVEEFITQFRYLNFDADLLRERLGDLYDG